MAAKIGEDGLPFLSPEEFQTTDLTEIDELRRTHGLVRTDPRRVMVLRSEDVERLTSDPSLLQLPAMQYTTVLGIPDGRVASFLHNVMLMANGEDHKRRRGAFTKTFAHPVIRAKRAEVRAVADRVVADLPRGERFDFLALCSSRLPAEMIAEVLGLDIEKSGWFATQVYSLSRCLMAPYAVDDHDEIEAAAEALYQFVTAELDARRAEPRDDLLSMLVSDDSARALDGDELIHQVVGLILAGSDTTRSGFNMTVASLLGDRTLWDEVNANRDLIPAAIDEALRMHPPVGSTPRFAPAPVEIAGKTIDGMQLVGPSTLSALRDDARVANPDTFDLHRTDHVRPHMVFGGGAHRCLGEMLARIELEEGLAALLDGAPDIEMIEAPKMLGISGIRRSTPLIARIP